MTISFDAVRTNRDFKGNVLKGVADPRSGSGGDADVGSRAYNDGRYQGLDATLTAFAALVFGANEAFYATGDDQFAKFTITSQARGLLDDTSYSAMRTTLGLAIGSDVQAYHARLADLSGLTPTDGVFVVGDGTNFVAESGNTARTSLGLGTGDSPTFSGLTVSNNATISGNATVTGNLTVNGTTTTVNSTTVEVADSIYHLGSGNTSSDAVDIGVYGSFGNGGEKFAGFVRDASDGKFKFFTDLEDEPTTVVDTSGAGYTVATVVCNVEGNVHGLDVRDLSSRFTTGAADEIDGDQIDIDFSPSNYTPANVSGIAETAGNLSRHLKGIDAALASVASPEQDTFNATTDWGSADGDGVYTITIDAATHGKGVNVQAYVEEDGSTEWIQAPVTARVAVNKTSGDVTIKVGNADSRFAGRWTVKAI